MYLISRDSIVQKKLFNEIVEVIGENQNVAITYQQLLDLKYMECVIKESFRLFPPVPTIGRYIDEDIELGRDFACIIIIVFSIQVKN